MAAILCFKHSIWLSLVLLSVGGCSDSEHLPSTFAIATGGPAGMYYPFGGGMASLWSKELPGVNVKAEVTGGSVTNVIQVARRESELGIAMADVISSAYHGSGRFPEALPLRVLFTIYPNVVHILSLKENNISGVADLKGRRVSLGAAGSGTAVAAENVLRGLALELDDVSAVYLNFGETAAALKDGTIDAGFVVGGLGLAAVTELAVTRNLQLVSLTEDEVEHLRRQYPTYAGFEIPASTYDKVDQPTLALGIWSAVVVHEDFPEELAYAMTCQVYKYRDRLLNVAPVASAMNLDTLHMLPMVPLHTGSARFAATPTQDCDG